MMEHRFEKSTEYANGKDFRFLWFSELLKRPVVVGSGNDRLGKLTDLVFKLTEPYAEAVGVYIEHGWGKPTEFVPWNRVTSLGKDKTTVQPPEEGPAYPPFIDQPGWILLEEHLMGRTVLDTDGRRVEVVNDIHLLESKGRLIIVHVDTSFNGFLRKWGLGSVHWVKESLIPWRYVQPFSLEDAVKTDAVSLSVTKEQATDLPGEDLADVLEMLSGEEQEAFFSALDADKAAETLMHAEPRARRQLVEDLSKERAESILEELSIPQLADLFSDLPHDDAAELMQLLPEEQAERLEEVLHEHEAEARKLMSSDYLAFAEEATIGETLGKIRNSGMDPETISYVYVVAQEILTGVVDIRELILTPDDSKLGDIMSTAVVSAEEDKTRTDLEEIFGKYNFRMVPVVDKQDRLLGIVRYNDLMQSADQNT
jgi:CBS domain-containing protein/sporulation protein YlmC with PRC-barrel domain